MRDKLLIALDPVENSKDEYNVKISNGTDTFHSTIFTSSDPLHVAKILEAAMKVGQLNSLEAMEQNCVEQIKSMISKNFLTFLGCGFEIYHDHDTNNR